MTVVITSRIERKKSAIRERIISEGIRLFARDGIERVTVEQIAEAADVGKGTIYNYFDTKESIIVAFMVQVEAKVQESTAQLIRSRKSPVAILTAFVMQQFEMKQRHYEFVKVFLGQMFTKRDQFLPYLVDMQKAIDPPLQTLFEGLQQRGAIRRDIAVADLVNVFKTVQLGMTALWAIEGPPFVGTESAVKQGIKIFCEGLKNL